MEGINYKNESTHEFYEMHNLERKLNTYESKEENKRILKALSDLYMKVNTLYTGTKKIESKVSQVRMKEFSFNGCSVRVMA